MSTSTMKVRSHRSRRKLSLVVSALVSAIALTVVFPATALADPPPALPSNASSEELTFQPAMDYDGDGCYPTPAIGPDGTLNPGLNTTGALNGNCRDASDLDNTNSYSRSKCNNGWCAYLYTFYFEKDQIVHGSGAFDAHRHDWEHVAVWVEGGQVRYVSTSEHGDYAVHPASDVAFEGSTHPKVVYHKDEPGTHSMRLASATEPPENHHGAWQYPDLVGWDGYPPGIRERLTSAEADAHFDPADFPLRDAAFNTNLASAMPDGIPFDPNA